MTTAASRPDLMAKRNWIENRGLCRAVDVFERLIERIEADVEKASEYNVELQLRKDYDFEIDAREDCLTISAKPPASSVGYDQFEVVFERRENTIKVSAFEKRGGGLTDRTFNFEIVPSWDAKKGKCRLLIDGNPYKLWQISQKALAGLFNASWASDEPL